MKKIKNRLKFKFKEIFEIKTYFDENRPRKFYYKITDKSKFLSFVELIHTGKINIYINASMDLDLFYSEINEFIPTQEWMNELKNNINEFGFISNDSNGLSLKGNNYSKQLLSKYNYFYGNVNFRSGVRVSKTDYFLQKLSEKTLTHIGSSGNFLYKNFKKTASKYFEDCPVLVEKIKSRKLKLKHLSEILEFYNTNCYNSK